VNAAKGTPEYDEIFERLQSIAYAAGADEGSEEDDDEDHEVIVEDEMEDQNDEFGNSMNKGSINGMQFGNSKNSAALSLNAEINDEDEDEQFNTNSYKTSSFKAPKTMK